jgi:putative hydrolase of HD superfamily
MKNNLDFLIKINKLKEMPRTGWILMDVKNPETIAEHIFRVAVAAWLLGAEKKLNIERAIKIALSHDLCELYAGDMTPFSYYLNLPQNKKERKKMLMKWVRLSKKEKEKRGKIKFQKEKKGLLKLIKSLSPGIRKEIFSSWFDYENRITKEGRFVKELDRIETLIQSIEYFGKDEKVAGSSWWEGTEEIVEDPMLLDFLKVIQKKLYGKKIKGISQEKELGNILDFLLQIGKLKKMPRLYWVIREIKEPETVAGHVFTSAMMAWIFGSEKDKGYNMEKLLKMALCHEISAVYAGDMTPYHRILPESRKKRRETLGKWVRLSKKEKTRYFIDSFKREKKAFNKLNLKLKSHFKKEVIQLWKEYKTKSTKEGQFLSQIDVLAVLLQAFSYDKKERNFLVTPIWEWAFEKCDKEICFDFFDEIKRKFY